MSKLIFEKGVKGSNSFSLPEAGLAQPDINQTLPPIFLRHQAPDLPQISEVEAVRHYTELSQRAYGVDNGFYPLGSCTMKYSPKINEWAARIPGLAALHPYQAPETIQGALQLYYEMQEILAEITGMDGFTLQPAAGAHGEMVGVMIIKAYHLNNGDKARTKMMVPDSAHGTNPATANMIGFDVIEVKSNPRGLVDLDDLKSKMNEEVAGGRFSPFFSFRSSLISSNKSSRLFNPMELSISCATQGGLGVYFTQVPPYAVIALPYLSLFQCFTIGLIFVSRN
jgi:glycine dehydrogenase subunit 2